jgi:hypothetical protein
MEESKDKTLYEEEDEAVEEKTKHGDENEADLYFRNPHTIKFKKKPVHDTVQLEREILSSSDINDLVSFMNQFKR